MWSTPRIWDEYVNYFQALGYKTHTPALPQHFTANQADHAADLRLKDYLSQLEYDYKRLGENAIIVGHSMGGLLAQQLAARVKPSALVLLAPAPPSGHVFFHPHSFKTLFKQLAIPLFWKKGLKPSPGAANYGLFNRIPEAQKDSMYQRLCFSSGRALFELALWYADKHRTAAVAVDDVTCPVLTLVGKDDRITPPSACKKVAELYKQKSHFHQLSQHAHMLTSEPGWEQIAQQIHVWLCWQLGNQEPKAA